MNTSDNQTVRIRSCCTQDVTVIPNDFLDRYLPEANGDFLKVYLCLLRSAGRREDALSLSAIADRMNCTENDVRRALRYWEKQGVLLLTVTEDGGISEILFAGSGAPSASAAPSQTYVEQAQTTSLPAPKSPLTEPEIEITPIESFTSGPDPEQAAAPRPSDITTARLAELGTLEEIRELYFVTQQYFGRPLKRSEMQSIAFFYDTLEFSASLIDYLIEYCVGRDHKSFRYIEKVAADWKEQGITTVLEAKNAVGSYHREYYDILKALGINNHHPIEAETTIMQKWLESYHFSMELITEACTRTVMNAAKPTLNYADSILTRWFKSGVKTLADVKQLDAEHVRDQAAKSAEAPAPVNRNRRKNAFTNFEQRTYDYSSLEQQLLKCSGNQSGN